MGETMRWEMREVPPPKEAPRDAVAAALGVLDCLRVEGTFRAGGRCSKCHRVQRDTMPLVWVPDSLAWHDGDSADDVREVCRANAFNGSFSGWCVPCAEKLGRPKKRWWFL